jgi:hypothetical protein
LLLGDNRDDGFNGGDGNYWRCNRGRSFREDSKDLAALGATDLGAALFDLVICQFESCMATGTLYDHRGAPWLLWK